jgi:ribulose bisphosphate carboxylase small subunit
MQSLPKQMPVPSDTFISELASEIYPAEEVASRHGYSIEQLSHLLNQGWFKARLREAKGVWSADSNATERVRIKAALAAEHTLLDITKIIQDMDAPPASRITAHQHITKLSGIDNAEGIQSNDVFRVVINLPTGNLDVSASKAKVIEGETVDE